MTPQTSETWYRVRLEKGRVVPKHSHHTEQRTYILEGALTFTLGDHQGEEVVVRAGEMLLIPSNVPHMAVAVEDTIGVEVFSPPRQVTDKADAHLRC